MVPSAMARSSTLFWSVASILAVVFALSAIGLVVAAKPAPHPRLSQLTMIRGILRDRSWGSLALAVGGIRQVIPSGACSSFTTDLKPGDDVTVWVDKEGRAWRVARGPGPICTFVQAITASDASRHKKRVGALVVALAGVGCALAAIVARFRRG
jgi:hypothetical protein